MSRLPTIDDYLGYVFWFPSLFTGPSFDFAEYKRWLDLSMFDTIVKDSISLVKVRKRTIPSSHVPATRMLIEGTVWLLLFGFLSAHVSVQFALSDEFAAMSMWHRFADRKEVKSSNISRLLYLQPLGLSHRLKYYGIWKLTEGACVLSGLGFNGYDARGRELWNRVTNVRPISFEIAQNNKTLLEEWNMNTNKWLKNYVYFRVTPRGRKPGFLSSMATFTTSAVWHGFYPYVPIMMM